MLNNGDIMKFFREADLNNDNFVSKAELKIVLEKLGMASVSDQDLTQIFASFDVNKDGRISYSEICKQFAEFSKTKAITDHTHWSFYIFENIRRACRTTQQPLAKLFGLQNV
jgi:Ca2+-binding EF-hand superfamily protein